MSQNLQKCFIQILSETSPARIDMAQMLTAARMVYGDFGFPQYFLNDLEKRLPSLHTAVVRYMERIPKRTVWDGKMRRNVELALV